MKQIIKEIDKKFIIALLIIALLGTVFGYQLYATITSEMDSEGSEENKVTSSGRYITLSDLIEKYDILCCFHGGEDSHLPSSNNAILSFEAGESQYSTTTTDSGKEIGKLIKGDEGETALTIKKEETSASDPYGSSSVTAESYAFFHVESTEIATPKESYILAEMLEEVNGEGASVFYDDGYSYIQYAWWTTEAGSKGNIVPIDNSLASEATAFEAYIGKLGSTDPNTFVEQSYNFEVEGVVHSGTVPAPVLDYSPTWNLDANQDGSENEHDEVTVSWDDSKQAYVIGPFSIDYVEESFDAGDREEVVFAGIIDAKLYTNLGEVADNKWRFYWLDGQRSSADDFEFPHANEVFYIELDYIVDATEVVNVHFDFKYMNAGGKFDSLDGTYFKETWTPKSKVIEKCSGSCGHSDDTNTDCDGKCSHGYSSEHPTKYQYWMELTGMQQKTAQLLAYGIIGARWYEYAELDTDIENIDVKYDKMRIKIIKEIVDENGNVVDTDQDKEFTFKIFKDGELYKTVKVSAQKPYTSQVFKWRVGEESAPQFKVVEVEDEDYKQVGTITKTGNVEDGLITFKAQNTAIKNKGQVKITKEQIGTGLENQKFEFKLYLDNKVYVHDTLTAADGTITIGVGETWTSGEISWTGDAPKYKVNEINLPTGVELLEIVNSQGFLIDGETIAIVASNQQTGVEYETGTLKVSKVLEGNASSDDVFSFKIKVGDLEIVKELKAGQTWTETFVWEKGENPPTYEVEEINIPEGSALVEITNQKGSLADDKTISVICINEIEEEEKGKISIYKETVSDDKEGVDENSDEFTFKTTISGTFEMSGESIVNGTKTIESTLKSNETVTLDEITWRGEAPTYTVEEIDLPTGWVQESISNDSGTLINNETIKVECINYFGIIVKYDLTMEMSGKVWEDTALNEEDKNTEDSKPNGQYDSGSEYGIEKVEIVIWKKVYYENGEELTELRKHATGYEEGTGSEVKIDFPLYTDIDGIWEAPRMSVPALTDEEIAAGAYNAKYEVEFIYDGQTYKPTDFLVSGTVEHFRTASNADKSQYLNDSMAYEVEEERASFDKKFTIITGDSVIDDNGETVGYATDENGTLTVEELLYYSEDSLETVDGNTRKISELQTTDSEGYIREAYKMSSRTSTGGLTYPFDDKVHLENITKTLDKCGETITYKYSATYPYLLNINLGLVRRDEAELAVTKDVYSAAVIANQKLVNYKYNEYVDFESEEYEEYLNLQLKIADANIAYKLDLYESDYYYRAKVYEGSEAGGALQEFYNSINRTDLSDELDLDVFLTYKISIYNNSDSYLAQVKSLVDYFDEDLELVTTTQTKYIQEANGVSVDETLVVAEPSYVIKKGPTTSSMWGEINNKSIENNISVDYGKTYNSSAVDNSNVEVSDSVKSENSKLYYKTEIDLSDTDFQLKVGEKLEVYLTFKVKTDEAPTEFENVVDDAVNSYVRLGTKANIAEIEAYSTYYADTGTIAGKVDKDSAPNNVDIENKNEKEWYEDDSDSAPIITLDLYTETRNINGLAWEDEETEEIDYNQMIGNGIYDDSERLIGNLTTQIVEKVRVLQSDGTYKEYDFVWPTSTKYDFLNDKSLEEITGFDSVTLTSNAAENTGEYSFNNIPAGNYVVRFIYGDFPSDMDETGGMVKTDADEPKTSDDNSRDPAVYNGQDFKTTTYQVNNIGDDGTSSYSNEEGYIVDEWYDFTTCKYDEDGNVIHNSDAIDNEARRLEVVAYSKVIDHTISTVLATANEYYEEDGITVLDRSELYENTSMYADTAKINLNIENMTSLKGQTIVITNETTGETETVNVGEEITRDDLITNSVYGKSIINGDKGTITLIDYSYNIEAIDMGLEERSNTELVLDKEIESIELTTNTGDTILKAVFDISYTYTLDTTTGKTSYEANVELNDDASYGTSNLMAENKDEANGLQNFRYIYYDDSIAQGLSLEVVYRFTALNVGEVDRTGKLSEMSTAEEILAEVEYAREQVYVKDGDTLKRANGYAIGEYVGSIYYLGKREAYTQSDSVVTTKVRQLIDYVDNDAVFKGSDNIELNSSWKSTTADELLANNVIDNDIIKEYDGVKNIVDDKGVVYTTSERNNLILSVDNIDGDKGANPELIVEIVPYAASLENSSATDISCMAGMNLIMTRSIDTQIDDDDLSYDNIAEIVKFENEVGKRDIETISGNADPQFGEFAVSIEERDSSATELITFTPPTGLGLQNTLKLEILIVVLIALTILLVGVILIKKVVLKK